jgi:phosphoserine phosphatase RsbU/P
LPAEAAITRLDPGDTLLLFTDGVTEAFNPAKEEFGDSLLLETLRDQQSIALTDFVTHLFDSVDRFAAGEPQADDITCVAIRRNRTVQTAKGATSD